MTTVDLAQLPDGVAFVGFPWTSETIDLPANEVIVADDGSTSEGAPIDWTGVTFATPNVYGLTFIYAFNAGARQVTVNLSGDQVAASPRFFRWYLVASNYPNAPLLWQRVRVGRMH